MNLDLLCVADERGREKLDIVGEYVSRAGNDGQNELQCGECSVR